MNVAKRVAGQPRFVAKRVGEDVVEPPTPGGGPGVAIPELISTNEPPDAFASWQTGPLSIVEGRVASVVVQTSRPVDTNRVIPIVLDPASSIDPGAVTFPSEALFLAGENEKRFDVVFGNDAAAGNFESCVLKLDPDASTGSSAPVLPTNTAFGPDELTIIVTDDVIVGGPADWTLTAVASIAEGAGAQTWQISLDKETTDGSDVVIDVNVTGGTAQATEDYVFTPQRVTIPGGAIQGTYDISFPNNDTQVAPGFDPTLEITATYVSGSVASTAQQSFTTTILDNDDGTSTRPIVQFTSAGQQVEAGRVYTVTVFSVNENNQAQNPGTLAEFPIEVTEANGIANNYVVDWVGDPGTATMQPDQNRVSFTVTLADAIPIGDPPPTLRLRLKSPAEVGLPSSQWVVGVQNTTELIVRAEEPTELVFPSFSGVTASRPRFVQGLYAIDPPSPTVTEMSLTTGIKAQCFGHKRDADGNWIAGYFYAPLESTAESVPDASATVTAIRPTEDGDAAAVVFGLGSAETLTFSLKAANQANLYEANVSTMGSFDTGNWSSEEATAVWTSVGTARYIDENVTRIPLVRADISAKGDGNHYLAEEALGYIELTETKWGGDNIRVFHGRFVNGNWSQGKNPLATNPQVNGEIYIDYLDLAIPGGSSYDLTLGNAHPSQTLDGGLKSAKLLNDRTEDYFIPVCASYPFAFAIYPSGDMDAKARAEGYLDMRHIAWAAGKYGPTRNPIYGEGGEPTIDYKRMGLTRDGRQGWGAIKYIGDIQGDGGGPNSREGYKSAWANGTGVAGSEHARFGWFQSTGPGGVASPGPSGVDGAYGIVPWWGYWLRQKYVLYATTSRHNITYRDTNTWDPGWYWILAENTPQDPQGFRWQVPFIGNPVNRKGTIRHYHFNAPANTSAFDLWNTPDPATFQLAPTAQLYNSPAVAPPTVTIDGETQTEEYWLRNQYSMEAATYLSRLRGGAVDMWDGCRMQMAYAFREEVASFCSRLLGPLVDNSAPTLDERHRYSTAYIGYTGGQPDLEGTGRWLAGTPFDVPSPAVISNGDVRGFAWPMIWLAGFYAIAPDDIRDALNEAEGSDAIAYGGKALSKVHNCFRDIMTVQGIPSFGDGSTFDPDPNDDSVFGETSIATRTNAWPNDDLDVAGVYGSANARVKSIGVPFGQMPIWSRAARVFKEYVQPSAFNTGLDRALRWHEFIVQSHRQFSPAGGAINLPYCAVVSIGEKHLGPYSEVDTFTTHTLDDVTSGKFRWLWSATTQGGDDGGDLLRKTGWSSYDAAVGLNDDTYLSLFQDSWGSVQDLTEAQFAQLLATEVNDTIFNASNNTSYRLLGEWTFYAAYLAYLLNRVS